MKFDNWFSNFKPFDEPLEYNDVLYRTSEHFFQAMKTLDPIMREQIAFAPTASEAKRLGRSLQLRPDWNEVKIPVMAYALKYKFQKGTSWYKKLMSTGNEQIIELNNWHDNEWGNCVCDRCKDIQGKNYLGQLLMEIRDEAK